MALVCCCGGGRGVGGTGQTRELKSHFENPPHLPTHASTSAMPSALSGLVDGALGQQGQTEGVACLSVLLLALHVCLSLSMRMFGAPTDPNLEPQQSISSPSSSPPTPPPPHTHNTKQEPDLGGLVHHRSALFSTRTTPSPSPTRTWCTQPRLAVSNPPHWRPSSRSSSRTPNLVLFSAEGEIDPPPPHSLSPLPLPLPTPTPTPTPPPTSTRTLSTAWSR